MEDRQSLTALGQEQLAWISQRPFPRRAEISKLGAVASKLNSHQDKPDVDFGKIWSDNDQG